VSHASVEAPLLMGVLNCTPDSFHAGGRSMHAQAAIAHGLAMVGQGADWIDVGGESTRPGAQRVPADEQVRRVLPVIQGLRAAGVHRISIDTTLAEVARQALRAGASMVNDVSAATEDADMLRVTADAGAEIALMHRLVPPGEDHYSHQYEREPVYADVIGDIAAFLQARVQAAVSAGIPASRVLLDPGFGFGKSVAQNVQLLHRLHELLPLGHRLLVGVSRKSFLGAVTGANDPADRLPATLAAGLLAMRAGAAVLRVHDVAEHAQVRAVFRAARGC
jgi:dihydropteroate synthase